MTTEQDRYDFVNGLKNTYGNSVSPAQAEEIEVLVEEFRENSTAKKETMGCMRFKDELDVLFRIYRGHARSMDGAYFHIIAE